MIKKVLGFLKATCLLLVLFISGPILGQINVNPYVFTAPAPSTYKPVYYVYNVGEFNEDTNGSTETVTLASVIDPDDFVIASMYKDEDTSIDGTPSGWSQLFYAGADGTVTVDEGGAEDGDRSVISVYKIATGTEDGTTLTGFDFNSNATSLVVSRSSIVFKGVDTSSPIGMRLTDQLVSSSSPVGLATTGTFTPGALVDLIFFSENQGVAQTGSPVHFYEGSNAGGDVAVFMGSRSIEEDESVSARTYQFGSVGYGWGIVSFVLQGASGAADWHPNDDNGNTELVNNHAWSMSSNANSTPTTDVIGANTTVSSVAETSHGQSGVTHVLQITTTGGNNEAVTFDFDQFGTDIATGTNSYDFDIIVRRTAGAGKLRINTTSNDFEVDLWDETPTTEWSRITINDVTITSLADLQFQVNEDTDPGDHTIQVLISCKQD